MAKRTLTCRKYAREKVGTEKSVKAAPSLISEKSKVIKKATAKRRPNAKAIVKIVRKPVATKKTGQPAEKRGRKKKVQSEPSTPEEIEPSTPEIEIKNEEPESPSVFANCNLSQIQHGFNVLLPSDVVNTSQPTFSQNTPDIHSQTISSTVNAKSTLFSNVFNVQSRSSCTQYKDSQTVADGDNYLDFMLAGCRVETNKMVDCGIQCSIRAQCDAETSTSPMDFSPSEFDLLDEMFLTKMADRLDIDRRTMVDASREVLADIEKTYNVSQGKEYEDEDEPDSSDPMFDARTFDDFDDDYGFSAGVEDRDSINSPAAESIISASPQNFDFGI